MRDVSGMVKKSTLSFSDFFSSSFEFGFSSFSVIGMEIPRFLISLMVGRIVLKFFQFQLFVEVFFFSKRIFP